MELITPPSLLPVNTADLRAFVRSDYSDEDPLLKELIAAATEYVESYCGRILLQQTWQLDVPLPRKSNNITLPKTPIQKITEVHYSLGSQIYPTPRYDQLEVNGLTRLVFTSLPLTGRLKITFACGYGDTAQHVPAPLRQAVRTLAAYWFNNRDGERLVPGDVKNILAPYRVFALTREE